MTKLGKVWLGAGSVDRVCLKLIIADFVAEAGLLRCESHSYVRPLSVHIPSHLPTVLASLPHGTTSTDFSTSPIWNRRRLH